ncbi:MAG: caspase family protein [Nitrospirae bacterium]|nr:caspase family protein [Nitrospirota bacterium]MBF0533964.1 caspase family protein [Nitrospirota bacterium]MBF0616123.1 caspase family protein [Nitrospirota bacterium]
MVQFGNNKTSLLANSASFIAIVFVFIIAVGLNTPTVTSAAEPPSEPILRINTEMHTAGIFGIGVDAENKYLVTGSGDKTVKVWDIRDFSSVKLIQTLRVPIGEDREGKIFAVAISPDGKTIACGGYTGYDWDKSHSIYIFDRQTGKLKQHITDLPDIIYYLVYSKDGRFLASTLRHNGIRIYKANDYSLAASDSDYGDRSLCADFDKNGRLVTSSYDGNIRLYDNTFKLISKEKTKSGTQSRSVSFSPDGSKIAVGFDETDKVDILSGRDLSYKYSPDTTGLDAFSYNVSFSCDGKYLYAGYRKPEGNRQINIRKWPNEEKGTYKDIINVAGNTINQILPLNNGGIVLCSHDPSFVILDKNDGKVVCKTGYNADYRGNREGFQISKDAKTIRFWYENKGKFPKLFSLTERELSDVSNLKEGLLKPILKSERLNITNWHNNIDPELNGTALKLEKYETSRSLAIFPDSSSFLLGADRYLRLFDSYGRENWNIVAPGAAWDVNVSQNGKIAVAAYADGTIRWYRVSDGKELLAFFPHNDKKRWVLWTPKGYYDASVGGDDLVGWHLNRGKDKEADFFPASKFRSTYYRPDIVSKVLDTLDEDEAVRQANEQANRKTQTVTITEKLPPVVRILSPSSGAEVANTSLTVRYELRTQDDAPVTSIKVLVNGERQDSEKGITVKPNEGTSNEVKVTIPGKDSEIAIIAENRNSASEPAIVFVRWCGAVKKDDEFVIKPKLYILAIGVNRYKDKELRLAYSSKDATDFAGVMKTQKGKLYRDVEIKVITDENASKVNVLDGLDWIQKQVTSKDIAMVLLSGHGVNDSNGVYYYLPADVDTERLKSTAVPFSEIKSTVSALAGKTLFFIDTCHSGNVMGGRKGLDDINGVINELTSAENGAIVFAASTGRQYSLEDPSWGNGAFTKAVVEGLSGKADMKGSGRITVNMLDLYISERVKELTKGKQTPTTTKPATVPDFPIAVVK